MAFSDERSDLRAALRTVIEAADPLHKYTMTEYEGGTPLCYVCGRTGSEPEDADSIEHGAECEAERYLHTRRVALALLGDLTSSSSGPRSAG